jgi:hypothetical protein
MPPYQERVLSLIGDTRDKTPVGEGEILDFIGFVQGRYKLFLI